MSEELKQEISEFIQESEVSPYVGEGVELYEQAFDRLAVKLSQWQYWHSIPYRRIVDLSGSDVESWMTWKDVVPMPVSLFKKSHVKCFEMEYAEKPRVWFSSGTTSNDKSRTYIQDTELYDLVIRKEWEYFVGAAEEYRYLSLIPEGEEWPNSSLAHMFSVVTDGVNYYRGVKNVRTGKFELDWSEIVSCLNASVNEDVPVVVYGTSYAFAWLFEEFRKDELQWSLPVGSIMVDTGGFKGLATPLTREQMIKRAWVHFGISSPYCINEYGMSEMSSQFWTPSLVHEGDKFVNQCSEKWERPSWVRVKTVDPVTLQDDPDGVLVIYDLANMWSNACLMTQDQATISKDGTHISDMRRAPGAVAKGCSITAERALNSGA
ncbi:hypothetical protein [Streptomyces sp. CoH17]|uniref:hypothetical protein n=1 Tax=Streptomyces sp. CoH17 TaxID=2992806 RepID=UPI002270A474|nr:hypothetical protein [Streptomyces sp. CoH17]